jgi:hypothetical protein
MATHLSARVSLALTVCLVLALYGVIVANGRWGLKEADAAPRMSPTMDLSALMSDVDVVKLPPTEVSDLF